MTLYTVHEPEAASDSVTRADRTVLMPDRFNVWGFLFGILFLLWHRLWFAVIAWVAIVAVVGAVCYRLSLAPTAVLPLALLVRLFIGVEGNDLRRWALERRGFRCVAIVSGGARVDAELLFFHGRMAERAEPTAPLQPLPRAAAPAPTPAVIGMFGDDGR